MKRQQKRKEQSSARTAALGDVDVHAHLLHAAPGEVGHAAVGGLVTELHVHDLQAAGARGHVRVAAQHDQAVRGVDGHSVLVPGVVDLVLGQSVHVAGELEVPAHLDALAVLVRVGRDLEGEVLHHWGRGGE